jgi:hypothetical protein
MVTGFGSICSCRAQSNEEFEDTKEVIRIRNSKSDKQHNSQKKKDKRTNNDLQSTTQKFRDPASRTPLKSGVNLCAPAG